MKNTEQKVIASPAWTTGEGTKNATCSVKLSNQTSTEIDNPQIKFTLADNQTLQDTGHVNFTVKRTDGNVVTGFLTTVQNLPAKGAVYFSVAITSDAAISDQPDTFMVNDDLSDAPATQFSDITGFESLSITADTGGTISLYANGYQQARVYVHMVPYDKHQRYVTLTGSELTKLQNSITLVNYHNNSVLTKVGKYADGVSRWAYSLSEGDYEQPISRQVNISGRNDHQMAFAFYVMCPPGENEHNINVAASVTLSDGKTIIDTISGDGFDSSVSLTSKTPTVYHVGEEGEGSQGLLIERKTTFDGTEDYGDGWSSWGYTYSVSISQSAHPGAMMRDTLFYPEGSQSSSNSLPPVQDEFEYTIHSDRCCFYAHTDGLFRGTCYMFDDTDAAYNILGIGGYYEELPTNYERYAFNFATAHFYVWPGQGSHTRTAGQTMHCEFRDQYGNPGAFKARAYEGNNDSEHWGAYIDFLNY